VRIADRNELAFERTSAKLLLPKLPADILFQAVSLAKAVYDLSRSEVCLLLHYNDVSGYTLTVPKQSVDPGYIDYDASMRVPGALCVGTIHSHGGLQAYHSGTDLDDEEHSDGVHITLGDMNRYPEFSMSAEIVVNGNSFPVDFLWFEGLSTKKDLHQVTPSAPSWKVPKEWLQAIEHPDADFGKKQKKERREQW
jgi:proteasome lid subunit RPN8/RPN11